MTLRTALVIEGSAEGAKKAARETASAIDDVKKAASDASQQTAAVTDNLEKAGGSAGTVASEIGKVTPAAREAGTEIGNLGKSADDISPKFSRLGSVMAGFAAGIVGGAALGAVSGVIEGAVTALGTYAANAVTKTDEIDAALKSHIELIRQIKGAYADAEKGASSYGNNSVAILRFGAQQDASRLQEAYRDALPGGGLFNVGVFATGSGGFSDEQLGPFAETVRRFRQEMQEGRADVIAFRNEIAGIAETLPQESRDRTLAESILGDTEKAAEVLQQLRQAQDLIKGLGGDTQAAANALGGTAERYDELGAAAGTAAGQIDPATQAIVSSGNAAETAAGKIERYRNALGGVSASPVRASATAPDLTAQPFALGGVVDRPTLFGFGYGETGLMGEAGEEAIVPLKGGAVGARTAGGREVRLQLTRLSDGSLGVEVPKTFAYGGTVSGFRAGGVSMVGGGVSGGYSFGSYGGDIWGSVYSTLADGLSDVLTGVFDTVTSGDFSNFWENFAEIGLQISSRLWSQMVDQLVNALLSSVSGGGSAAAGSGFGGLGGLIGGFFGGGSSWFPSVPGGLYQMGGYTGPGGESEIGGVVHREEFVVKAPVVRKPGVRAFLEALNDDRMSGFGRGFQSGGHGSGTWSGNVVPFNQPEKPQIIINNNNGSRVDHEERGDGRGGRQDVFTLSDTVGSALGTKGGGADRTMQRRYGIRPRGIVR